VTPAVRRPLESSNSTEHNAEKAKCPAAILRGQLRGVVLRLQPRLVDQPAIGPFSAMSQVVVNKGGPTKRPKCDGVLYVLKTCTNGARGKWLNLRRLVAMERLLQHKRQKHLAR
jgi:hypothetical protein